MIVIDCTVAAVTVSASVLDVTPLWVAVTLLDPVPVPVASPPVLIVTAAVFDEFQFAKLVRSCVVPSVNVPVAVNWSVVPFAIEVLGAVIVIDCRVAAVTVSAIAFELIPFCVAAMLLEPTPAAVTNPPVLIVATAVLDEVHVTELVRFCIEPSLNVPVAVNGSVVPFAIDVLVAVIVIDCNVAAVTVSAIVFDVIPLWVAVMLLEPVPDPVASPLVLIVTAAVLEEPHVAEFVRVCVVPSENVPVAVN